MSEGGREWSSVGCEADGWLESLNIFVPRGSSRERNGLLPVVVWVPFLSSAGIFGMKADG